MFTLFIKFWSEDDEFVVRTHVNAYVTAVQACLTTRMFVMEKLHPFCPSPIPRTVQPRSIAREVLPNLHNTNPSERIDKLNENMNKWCFAKKNARSHLWRKVESEKRKTLGA